MTSPPLHSLTAQALDAKFARKQRRYESKYSASYLHHPSPPPRLAAPPRPPNPTFEALRAAAAHLNLPEQDEQHGSLAMAPAVMTRRHPIRKAMLGGTAALALCAVAAGSYYAWAAQASSGRQAAIGATLTTLGQRFHDFAANQSLFRTVSEKVALLRPAPAAEPAALAAAMPGQPTPDAVTPAPSASPPFSPTPSDAISPTGVQSPGPSKPAEAAARGMAAASIVTPQQPDSLPALARQVGLLVRDTQAENEKLRTDVVSLIGTLQAKLTDLDQRLAATTHDVRDEAAQIRTEMAVLAETLRANGKTLEQRPSLALARDPAAAASEPGKQHDGAALPASAADDGKAVAAEATATGSARIVPGYHVQAASFGVALLSDANAAPGQAGGRLVSVGDQVPGVGRVTGIAPHGTSWIVQTDHGTIQ